MPIKLPAQVPARGPQEAVARTSQRIDSLDAFRGLAIIMMFLVTKTSPFAQLRHAPWEGVTVADLVYPFFLFAAGISLELSFRSARGNPDAVRAYRMRFLRRCVILFAIGVLLRSLAQGEFILTLGTLQCIALSLLIAFPFVRISRSKHLLWVYAAFLLLSYLLSAELRPVGVPWEARWQQYHTLAEAIDVMIFGSARGEEGVLTTLFSPVAIILGIFVARYYSASRDFEVGRWIAFACAPIIAATILAFAFPSQSLLHIPIIPNLVSPSFSLLAAGSAILLLGIFHLLSENPKLLRLLRPLVVCGRNALAAYVFVKVFQELLLDFALQQNETQRVSVGMKIREVVTENWGDASGRLSIPLIKICVALLLCWYLDRKGRYIRL